MQLHDGVKKSGIMGFCDPCPGEPKQLYVEYTYGDKTFEVTISTNMSCPNSRTNTSVGLVILVVFTVATNTVFLCRWLWMIMRSC